MFYTPASNAGDFRVSISSLALSLIFVFLYGHSRGCEVVRV